MTQDPPVSLCDILSPAIMPNRSAVKRNSLEIVSLVGDGSFSGGGTAMRAKIVCLGAAVLGCLVAVSAAWALYSVAETGKWPQDWPAELEPLRKQSRTLVGPMIPQRHFAVPMKTREEFEQAWPHLLAVKTKGAPIFLVRGPNFFLGEKRAAGVVVHCPPEGQHKNPATPEKPIPHVENPRVQWMNTNYIELVVDGQIVDLNRIPLPADAPVIDERFPASDRGASDRPGK